MKCPVCDQDLVMSDRQGIEIDYCSKCRGVWLDRGELDKIIERSLRDAQAAAAQPIAQPAPQQPAPQQYAPQYRDERDYQRQGHGHGHDSYRGKHHRRKSWLSEIFD